MNMMDPAVQAFFEKRKEKWLKKEIADSADDSERQVKILECEQKFSLENWLPDAARRSKQRSFATHPCKFSHPAPHPKEDVHVSSIIAKNVRKCDGYLRHGNVSVTTDSVGNAAALDIYEFLTLKLEDGRELIAHIQEDSPSAISLLTIQKESYAELKNGFLAMIAANDNQTYITSDKIKQVYFPIENGYHQLSLLTNSGMVYELKSRIQNIRFSDEKKELRKRKHKNEYSEQGFSELYNLTIIQYGGSKPQNVSALNSQNGGKAFLLLSLPPALDKRKSIFPKNNFFSESLQYNEYRESFNALHTLFQVQYNNINIREGRDYHFQNIIDHIINRMWAIRAISNAQYDPARSQLKSHQKIWLHEKCKEIRFEENDWLETVCKEMTLWIIRTYEKLLRNKAYKLGEAERIHIYNLISESKEMLR